MNIEMTLYKMAQCAPGLLLALVCHEWAHGYVAKLFGDDTAERSGRLTLNPISHIDPIGTVVFPLVLTLFGALPFGWARPVPVSSRNFKNIRKGVFWVSFAGPLANFFLGTISVLLLVLVYKYVPNVMNIFGERMETGQVRVSVLGMLSFSGSINFVLMGFNLIPLPPLDGSRMLSTYLKGEALRKYEEFARYTPMIFLGMIFLSHLGGIDIFGFILGPFLFLNQFLLALFSNIF